ncbi:sigma-70 family RNA polymerase sigma factor [Stieleria sp. TO1_6]|uniref:RNA polymerase sigma factor n=1 Tax=Stieleria tagensis TaxID=2956795 RepID=UPI00209AC23C|nr:sigma-70 family RNA polymerase sigma factor [Stieleria tagensis]MCO8124199.1 sigma-70 family RNA polymerase sigma factor [Stieleria tagensis]
MGRIHQSADSPAAPSEWEISGVGFDSNAVLARRIVDQDAGAFAILVDRYHQFVFRICYGILGHRQDAEDATQETFSRVARYLDRWDPRRPLEPWLATVAGNRSRSQLAQRRSFTPLTAVEEPHSLSTPQAQAAQAMREEITLALAQLPIRQRVAFRCFHEQAMSHAEIARKLGCPVGTVKTLVHRARVSIVDQLQRRDVVSGATSTGDSS